MREREVEIHLKECVKAKGGEVRKVRWIGRRSAPDRLVLMPGHHYYVELKRPGETVTVPQQREHLRMRKAGIAVYVASTKEQVDAVILNAEIHSHA